MTILGLNLVTLMASNWIVGRVPKSAFCIATRLTGLLLLALAFDLAADGLKEHFVARQ